MDNQKVVGLYARLVVEVEYTSDEFIYNSLCEKEVSPGVATQAVQLIPIAFGRHILRDLGIAFCDKFWIFNSVGRVLYRGSLEKNKIFSAAFQLAPILLTKSVLDQVVFRSVEVNSVSQALYAGSSPDNLVPPPVVLFNDYPCAVGMQRAQEVIRSHLKDLYKFEPKPWWGVA
ncbi:MAG: hypothetical protein KME20_12400 [Kaiparowitsia implicata GSE-PSE-MK54-09C]|jgi:hypothetical protein|nr:hypothetical protein [Kaiparowitsia implicata GSE-PSE-MK54-09C]